MNANTKRSKRQAKQDTGSTSTEREAGVAAADLRRAWALVGMSLPEHTALTMPDVVFKYDDTLWALALQDYGRMMRGLEELFDQNDLTATELQTTGLLLACAGASLEKYARRLARRAIPARDGESGAVTQ